MTDQCFVNHMIHFQNNGGYYIIYGNPKGEHLLGARVLLDTTVTSILLQSGEAYICWGMQTTPSLRASCSVPRRGPHSVNSGWVICLAGSDVSVNKMNNRTVTMDMRVGSKEERINCNVSCHIHSGRLETPELYHALQLYIDTLLALFTRVRAENEGGKMLNKRVNLKRASRRRCSQSQNVDGGWIVG